MPQRLMTNKRAIMLLWWLTHFHCRYFVKPQSASPHLSQCLTDMTTDVHADPFLL